MEDITQERCDAQGSSNAASQLNRRDQPCVEMAPLPEPQLRADPWLVLRTRSRHENLVASSLAHKRITTFLPKHNVVRRWRDRRMVVEIPLFPGYIFVQPRAEQYENMRYIPGSCGLVFAGSKPAAMPERDLAAVRLLVRSGAALSAAAKLIPGKRVEVVSGPFMGIEGELVRLKGWHRLVINADLLSSSVSVEVDLQDICVL